LEQRGGPDDRLHNYYLILPLLGLDPNLIGS
jgi:hypothetical protein